MSDEGKLLQIWIKRFRRGPMDKRGQAILKAGEGLLNNANQGGKRQVTLIAAAAWSEMMDELGVELDPSCRRANLMIAGIDLANSGGKTLKVGPCRLLIHGETRPCERMDQAYPGLRSAMAQNWRGGAYAEVLDDGNVRLGDPVGWLEE